MDDEAISPVIGTILLVAIAVVMAGVVFVLVQGETAEVENPPRVAFDRDFGGSGGTFTVVTVDAPSGSVLWERMSLGPATTATCTLPASGAVRSGHTLTCSSEGHITLVYEMNSGETLLVLDEEVK